MAIFKSVSHVCVSRTPSRTRYKSYVYETEYYRWRWSSYGTVHKRFYYSVYPPHYQNGFGSAYDKNTKSFITCNHRLMMMAMRDTE